MTKTTETKHSPGPWRVKKITAGIDCFVITNGSSDEIAVILGVGTEKREANAQLITAAPELLRIAEQLLFVYEGSEMDKALNPDYGVDIDELKAIIAKAKGETQ